MSRFVYVLRFLVLVGVLWTAGHSTLAPPNSPALAAVQRASSGTTLSLLFADDFQRGTVNWQLNTDVGVTSILTLAATSRLATDTYDSAQSLIVSRRGVYLPLVFRESG